ncbi:MAG TPA: DNA-processing protein DprA [Patescibacteria group bacterium]|nr:DNA-processing protein DprA [Patescibacteria group bacterium]
MNEKIYTLGFSAFSGIGTKRFEKLVAAFESAGNAWETDEKDIIAILGKALGEKFAEFRKTFNLEKYAEKVREKGIIWLVPEDEEYPKLLKQLNNAVAGGSSDGKIHDDGSRIKSGMTKAPFILFAKGNVSLLSDEKTIGIVGTRKVTDYGRQVTEMFTRELVASGFTIISGMALGVDGIAHEEVIKNKGKTIAVLGSGVDFPTPREHTFLYQKILENNGLIVSTFRPGEIPSKGSFPARNAIIAGLSHGILVTEGAADSGSLITAGYAKKFDRFLFAVPGQITSQLSKGTNNLIKEGAIAVSSVSDILDRLGIIGNVKTQAPNPKKQKGETKEEQEIVDLLENGPLHFDEIVRTIGKDSKDIGSILSLMELKGLVKNTHDGKYSISF